MEQRFGCLILPSLNHYQSIWFTVPFRDVVITSRNTQRQHKHPKSTKNSKKKKQKNLQPKMCWYRTLGLENHSDKDRSLLGASPLSLNIQKTSSWKNPGDQKKRRLATKDPLNLPFQTSSANYKGKDMANKNRHAESTNSIFFQGLRISWGSLQKRGVWTLFFAGFF